MEARGTLGVRMQNPTGILVPNCSMTDGQVFESEARQNYHRISKHGGDGDGVSGKSSQLVIFHLNFSNAFAQRLWISAATALVVGCSVIKSGIFDRTVSASSCTRRFTIGLASPASSAN